MAHVVHTSYEAISPLAAAIPSCHRCHKCHIRHKAHVNNGFLCNPHCFPIGGVRIHHCSPGEGVLIWSVGCALDFPGEDIAKTDLAAVMFIVGSILFCISVGISNVLLWMDRYSLSHGTPDQLSWPTQHSETLTDVMRLSDDSVGSPQHQCDGRESSDTQV